MKTFSYFNRPISEVSDSDLTNWLIAFLNGCDPQEELDLYLEFMAEVPNRCKEFQDKVTYINSVL